MTLVELEEEIIILKERCSRLEKEVDELRNMWVSLGKFAVMIKHGRNT